MDILYQFASEIKELISDKRKTMAESVAKGNCSDWADYRHRTGRIKGLDDAENIISDLLRNQEIDE